MKSGITRIFLIASTAVSILLASFGAQAISFEEKQILTEIRSSVFGGIRHQVIDVSHQLRFLVFIPRIYRRTPTLVLRYARQRAPKDLGVRGAEWSRWRSFDSAADAAPLKTRVGRD